MRTEKLLDAIGEIDDQFIEDTAPGKKSRITYINWIKYGSIAACFLLLIVLIFEVSTIRMGSKEESAAVDSAAPEDMIMEDTVMEEAAVEEEAPAAEEPAEDVPTDEYPAEDVPLEEEYEEDINDVAYGIVVNDNMYFPISFQERKDFNLIDKDAAGLTPENTYKISENDLGEVIGIVTFSTKESSIGLTLYHYTKYPENTTIGILDNNGVYEFYILDSTYTEQ